MNNLIAKGKERNIDIEIFKTRNKCTDINSMNDTIKLFQISDVTRYKIKAIKNGKCIEIVTESLKNTNELLDALEDIFSLQENENKNSFCKNNLVEKVENREKIDIEKIKNDLLSLNDLKKEYPCIKSIDGSYSYYEKERKIKNDDYNMEDSSYFNAYGASITVSKNDVTRVLYLGYFSKNFGYTDPNKFAFDENNQYILESIMYSAMTLYSNGGASRTKLTESHRRWEAMLNSKKEEKLTRTQELNTAKIRALRELGYDEIDKSNASEVLDKIAEIMAQNQIHLIIREILG